MMDALYIATVGGLDRLDLWVHAWGFHHHIHLAKFQDRIKAMIHLISSIWWSPFPPKKNQRLPTLIPIGSYLRSAPTKLAISSTNCRSEWSMLCKFLSVTGCTAYEKTGVIKLPTKKTALLWEITQNCNAFALFNVWSLQVICGNHSRTSITLKKSFKFQGSCLSLYWCKWMLPSLVTP